MMRVTDSPTHDELTEKINAMSDQEFIRIIDELMKRRRKKPGKPAVEHHEETLPYV